MTTVDVTPLIYEAASALRAGERRTARMLLTQALAEDPENERALLWMSGAVDSAGKAGATQDRYAITAVSNAEPPRKKEIGFPRAAYREIAGVFQEERPFFGEKEVKAIEIDLLIVYLDLGKIRVIGTVEGQAGREAVFEIGARSGSGFPVAVG